MLLPLSSALVNLKSLFSLNFNCQSSQSSKFLSLKQFGTKLYHSSPNDVNEVRRESGAYHLFVGNLPFSFSERELQTIAADRGLRECIGYRIVLDKKTGRSRGFGFIDFDDENSLKMALNSLNGVSIEGRMLKVDITEGVDSPSKGRRAPTTSKDFSAFIGNLDFSISEDDLEGIVKNRLGEDVLVKARLVRVDGRSRGYGHIDFGSSVDVDAAILSLNGMDLLGRVINVEPAQQVKTSPNENRGRDRSAYDSNRGDGAARGGRDFYPARSNGGDRKMDRSGRGPPR